jgi:hypothetical protein
MHFFIKQEMSAMMDRSSKNKNASGTMNVLIQALMVQE